MGLMGRVARMAWQIAARSEWLRCRVCGGPTRPRHGYGRVFVECQDCGFIFCGDYPQFLQNVGMGMVGSWGGPAVGGEREDFLARMLRNDFHKERILLYGVGSAVAFPILLSEGFDVYGCDLSKDVIECRQNESSASRFFHVDELKQRGQRFDAIIACEVFEHFSNPRNWLVTLFGALEQNGIICGTTNFYPGGEIEDGQTVGYMSIRSHVAYWSESSLARAFSPHGIDLVAFEMICPGSVKPDLKFNDLFPNKRVFFLTADEKDMRSLRDLKRRTPILPLDLSDYPHPGYARSAQPLSSSG